MIAFLLLVIIAILLMGSSAFLGAVGALLGMAAFFGAIAALVSWLGLQPEFILLIPAFLLGALLLFSLFSWMAGGGDNVIVPSSTNGSDDSERRNSDPTAEKSAATLEMKRDVDRRLRERYAGKISPPS